MKAIDTIIATFVDHPAAEKAVKDLGAAGFEVQSLSIVGKGYHSEERVLGFYNFGDRIKIWGARGVFWGGLWGLFAGGLFVAAPVVGPVVVLGYLASVAVTALESAAIVGGASVLSAALYGIGISKASVVRYETAVKADGFLVMAHGSAHDIGRARAIIAGVKPASVERYSGMGVLLPEAE